MFKAMSMESTHPPAADAVPFNIGRSNNNGANSNTTMSTFTSGSTSTDGGVGEEASRGGDVPMVDYIPIEWWDSVHGEDQDITKQIHRITAPTIPLMRNFGNTAAMDILVSSCFVIFSRC